MTGLISYPHEVLAVVMSVRDGRLCVLLSEREAPPFQGHWALPGGGIEPDERLREAITRHLAATVDSSLGAELAHLEQLATHSAVDRDPRARVLATAYLGLVPSDATPQLPAGTAWQPADAPLPLAFDHHFFVEAALDRLRAKLSYTNIGFALAPREFPISELRGIVGAALGYDVGATNLTRVLTRRNQIEPTGNVASAGHSGGRPAALFRFRDRELVVTDPFAVLKPPT